MEREETDETVDTQTLDYVDVARSAESVESVSVDATPIDPYDCFDEVKPGLLYPSKPDDKPYYDFKYSNLGTALIFVDDCESSASDVENLKNVLDGLGCETKIHEMKNINEELLKTSQTDHSSNDCLLITIVTNQNLYSLIQQEPWQHFMGNNCKALIGKPKLFFIQSSGGKIVESDALLKQKKKKLGVLPANTTAEKGLWDTFVIPSSADVLIMYSTASGNNLFIRALCDELRDNSEQQIMTILTGVNRRVANGRKSEDETTVIEMTLTKSFYFRAEDAEV